MQTEEFSPGHAYLNTIKNMNALYEFWNEKYFNGELETPVITVRKDERRSAYGWFVPKKIWASWDKEEGSVEINMVSQYLNRPIEEIAETMLHEMCHHYAYVKNIQDTSRKGYYHNRRFKEIAEQHGLCVSNSGSFHGWCETSLSDESKKLVKDFVPKGTILFDLSDTRKKGIEVAKIKLPSQVQYICPICHKAVVSSKSIKLICVQCNERMKIKKDLK